MPLYFFNVFNGSCVFDDVGVDLPNVRATRKHMISMAIRMIDKVDLGSAWRIEALSDRGELVSSFDFGTIL